MRSQTAPCFCPVPQDTPAGTPARRFHAPGFPRGLLLLALAAALALGACASVESVKEAKGHGVKRTFRYSGDAVFQALLTIGARRKLELVEQDRAAGIIVFSSGASLTSLGERIAVFITRASGRSTALEVVSQPMGGALTFPPDWPAILYGDLEHELALQKLK